MEFDIRVVTAASAPRTLRIEAVSQDEASTKAKQQGYTVLSVSETATRKTRAKFPLLMFCHELTTLLDSGLLLTQALETLYKKEKQASNQGVLAQLLTTVKNGQSFSDGLAAQSRVFPHLFIAMVKACETTGNLAEGIARFAHYLEQVDVLKKRIVSASIYPLLILSFGLLVMLFLLGYVVPRFSEIYASRNTDLSWTSELLLHIGTTVNQHGLVLLGCGVVSVTGLIYLFSLSSVRKSFISFISGLPIFGERFRIYHLSRFYRTFAMLLRSGIPVVSALSMVSELMGVTLMKQVEKARYLITQGKTFSRAMHEAELLTSVAEELFKVGENAGNLDEMMERTAAFHEEEMMRWVDAFSKVVEPILMAMLGIVIGGIVFLMYMPIFELASGL
jgi:general secretion pathway protein F